MEPREAPNDEASPRDLASHFAFGRNWLEYAKLIDEERIGQATSDLRRLAGGDLAGKSFLDIGCGSGLHALAALRLGAVRVEGFDLDPDSVAASRATIEKFAPESAATFRVQSVFDARPDDIGFFDIVYSWGVLHHTGDMREAIRCAAELVPPGGHLILALYRKTAFCGVWRVIKRWYSSATPARQAAARRVFTRWQRMIMSLRGLDFRSHVTNYAKNRGMDYEHDVHDWLGGYPYDSISVDECVPFMQDLGFDLEDGTFTPVNVFAGLAGSGCDEYRFVRRQPGRVAVGAASPNPAPRRR